MDVPEIHISAEIGEVYDCFIFAVSGYLCSALEEKKFIHLVMSASSVQLLYCSRNGYNYQELWPRILNRKRVSQSLVF